MNKQKQATVGQLRTQSAFCDYNVPLTLKSYDAGVATLLNDFVIAEVFPEGGGFKVVIARKVNE